MAQVRQAGEQLFTRDSAGQVRLGIWIEVVTIAWMTFEASIAITIGYMTRSVSLQGFGIDSVIELIAGVFCCGACWLSSGVLQPMQSSARRSEQHGLLHLASSLLPSILWSIVRSP